MCCPHLCGHLHLHTGTFSLLTGLPSHRLSLASNQAAPQLSSLSSAPSTAWNASGGSFCGGSSSFVGGGELVAVAALRQSVSALLEQGRGEAEALLTALAQCQEQVGGRGFTHGHLESHNRVRPCECLWLTEASWNLLPRQQHVQPQMDTPRLQVANTRV